MDHNDHSSSVVYLLCFQWTWRRFERARTHLFRWHVSKWLKCADSRNQFTIDWMTDPTINFIIIRSFSQFSLPICTWIAWIEWLDAIRIHVWIINQNVISENNAHQSQGSLMWRKNLIQSTYFFPRQFCWCAPSTDHHAITLFFFLLSRKGFELGVNIVISHDENKRNCIRHTVPPTMTTTSTAAAARRGQSRTRIQ